LATDFSIEKLEKIFSTIPAETELPNNLKIYLSASPEKDELLLHYRLEGVQEVNLPHTLGVLTPFPHLPFAYKQEQLYRPDNKISGVIPIAWEGEFEEPPMKLPRNGICHRPWKLRFLFQNPQTGKISIISKVFTQFQTTGVETEKSYYQTLPSLQRVNQSIQTSTNHFDSPASSSQSIWIIILLAFLGGIILNVMPCVLPVISIKLF
jgi:thiol:disulfide interchange protein DsbD